MQIHHLHHRSCGTTLFHHYKNKYRHPSYASHLYLRPNQDSAAWSPQGVWGSLPGLVRRPSGSQRYNERC